MMHQDNIPTMTKFVADGVTLVPLSSNTIRIIDNIKNLVWQNMIDKMPGAKLASTSMLQKQQYALPQNNFVVKTTESVELLAQKLTPK